MLFAEFTLLQDYLPYVVGCSVALGVAVVWFVRWNRTSHQPPPFSSANPISSFADLDDDDTFANRRSSSRREGQPVRVIITAASLPKRPISGWVMDRSTGGLRIMVKHSLPPGSAIQVRTSNAPDTVPWTTLVIRSCREVDDRFEIGCAFETTPPWNVLLLFG